MRTLNLYQILIPYAVLPLLLGIVAADVYLFDGLLNLALPMRPEFWFFWVYIFGLPHLFASAFTLVDKEYWSHHGSHLMTGLFIIVTGAVALKYGVSNNALFAVFTAMIVYHTISQQFGITLSAMKAQPTFFYQTWKWSAVLVGCIVYAMLYRMPAVAVNESDDLRAILTAMAWGLTGISALAGIIFYRQSKPSKQGLAYIVANIAFILSVMVFFEAGYFAFIIIAARVIHEFCAWPIYMVHDHNRNMNEIHNLVYRQTSRIGLRPWIANPVLAFAISIPLTWLATQSEAVMLFVIVFSLFHYWSEGFLWKGRAIHRRSLSFS